MRRGPVGRRTYKLPRKVVQLKRGSRMPKCGGWVYTREERAREAASIADKRCMYGSWIGGDQELHSDFWTVLNEPQNPEANKWGEVHP